MTYEELVKSVLEIVDNENIMKDGLTLNYEVDAINHRKINEYLYLNNPIKRGDFMESDIIEVEILGLLVKIIKNEVR